MMIDRAIIPFRTSTPHRVVLALGIVLLFAASLKFTYTGDGGFGSRDRTPVSTILACGEFCSGILLILTCRRTVGWLLALGTFAFLFAVAAQRAVTGATNCGCFGRFHVAPSYSATFDAFAVGLLIACGRMHMSADAHERKHRWRAPAARLTIILFAVFGASALLARLEPKRSSDDASPISRLVILDPKRWVGKRLPLLNDIDIGSRLSKGRWFVVLYHWDCEHCRGAIPRYQALAEARRSRQDLSSVALVELPPYAPAAQALARRRFALDGRLSERHDWFGESPIVLTLVDGRVVAALEGDEAVRAEPAIVAAAR